MTSGRYFKDITRPMVVNGGDLPDQCPARVMGGQADQVGMVVLVIRQRRQSVAGHEEAGATQGVGLFLRLYPFDSGTESACNGTGQVDVKLTPAVFGEQRTVFADGGGFRAERLEPQLSRNTERPGNGPDADHVRHQRVSRCRAAARASQPARSSSGTVSSFSGQPMQR